MAKLTSGELFELAHRRASARVPKPAWDPVAAGVTGAAVTGFVIAVFIGLTRTNASAVGGASLIVVAAGFLLPFGILKLQEREYYKVWAAEYAALLAENSEK